MKLSAKPELLKILTLSAGVLGLLLRVVLYAAGTDEKGLLVTGHWASVSLWILTALLAAGLFLLTRSIQGPEDYADAHPVSFFGGAGAVAAAVTILIVTIGDFGTEALLATLLGFAAAASLAAIAFFRLTGRKPLFLFHVVLCGFFAMRMVSQYRFWNSDPQLMDYVFYLSAYVLLMLASYQQAAFDADLGNHRNLWYFSLLSVYLCIVSLKGSADTWLILACGLWAFSNLTDLRIRRRRQRPALNLEDEPQEEV